MSTNVMEFNRGKPVGNVVGDSWTSASRQPAGHDLYQLIFVDASGSVQTVLLQGEVMEVSRDFTDGTALDAIPSVSDGGAALVARCIVGVDERGCFLIEQSQFGSGIFVNGERLGAKERRYLSPYDLVTLGSPQRASCTQILIKPLNLSKMAC